MGPEPLESNVPQKEILFLNDHLLKGGGHTHLPIFQKYVPFQLRALCSHVYCTTSRVIDILCHKLSTPKGIEVSGGVPGLPHIVSPLQPPPQILVM